MLKNVAINNNDILNNFLNELLNSNITYGLISIKNCNINTLKINKLLKSTNVLSIESSKITVNSILMLDACCLSIEKSTIKIDKYDNDLGYMLEVNTTTMYSCPEFKIINCKFEEHTSIYIPHSNLYKFIICETYNINSIQIQFSNIKDVELRESRITETIFEYSNIFDLYICNNTEQNIYFSGSHICNINIDKYNVIKYALNCNSTVIGGIFGKILKFDIYGYKKVTQKRGNSIILYIKIPKGSKIYINETNRKCRTDKIIPLYSVNEDGSILSKDEDITYYPLMYNDGGLTYKVGKLSESDFDDSLKQCTNGIHFFFDLEEAIKY